MGWHRLTSFRNTGLAFVAAIGALFSAAGLAGAGNSVPAYVGSAACTTCHAAEATAWAGSHHALAWTEPTPETVRGDFENSVYDDGSTRARFFRENGRYVIETTGADGVARAYPVVGVAGWTPLQQYLLQSAPGRTQAFDIGWDVAGRRWFPVLGDLPPPGDGLHWTGPYKSWEARCAECHATGFVRHYDTATRSYAPTEAERGVGCEACHGPGAAHVRWAREGTAPAHGLTPHGLTVDLAASAGTEVQQCATCHARREAFADGNPLPGTPFHDAYGLSLLRAGVYFPDGSIDAEDYEFGSFLQSKMYAASVRCSNCHEPHATTLRAEGNAVCTQCHSPAGNPDFPSLRLTTYDDPAHTFHPQGSPGAACVACHMPTRTYMGVDVRRDHYFRVPRPDLAATGAPDACTACHADRGADWAAAEIARRFPDPAHRGPSYATTFAAARWNAANQVPALLAIGEGTGAGIVRATAVEMIPPSTDPATVRRLAGLLSDPDPLVRAAVPQPLGALPPDQRLALLAPLLADPVRSVRIAGARALADAGPGSTALSAARAELATALAASADFPETQLQIGGLSLRARDWARAEAAFEEATVLDPQLVDAWFMLVRIRAALGNGAGARTALAAGLKANPGAPALLNLQTALRGQP